MSVINQMLKDLDARDGGDAQRRAARTAAGQGVQRAPPGARSLRAAALVAVLATAALAALLFWWWLAVGAEPPPASPLRPEPMPVAEAPAPPTTAATAPQPAAPQPAAPQPAAPPRLEPTPVAEAPAPPITAAPAPPPAPARSRIEVLPASDADPLAAVRDALANGDAQSALRQLESARASSVPSAETEALAAAALQQLGRHEAAIAAYTRALRGEPDIGAWWVGLGISLEAASRGGEALSAYREAQRRGPLDAALADYVGERVEALSPADDSGATSR